MISNAPAPCLLSENLEGLKSPKHVGTINSSRGFQNPCLNRKQLEDRNSSYREDVQGISPLDTVVLTGKSSVYGPTFLKLDAFVRREFILSSNYIITKVSESQKWRTRKETRISSHEFLRIHAKHKDVCFSDLHTFGGSLMDPGNH